MWLACCFVFQRVGRASPNWELTSGCGCATQNCSKVTEKGSPWVCAAELRQYSFLHASSKLPSCNTMQHICSSAANLLSITFQEFHHLKQSDIAIGEDGRYSFIQCLEELIWLKNLIVIQKKRKKEGVYPALDLMHILACIKLVIYHCIWTWFLKYFG
jgi:hypothetical protein